MQKFVSAIQLSEIDTSRAKVPILKTCQFTTKRYGRIEKRLSDLREMAANFALSRGKRDVPFDYDHGTAAGSPRFTPESAIAAGWIHGLSVVDEGGGKGTLLADVEFTARALGFIKNKEYKYVSSEWYENFEDDQTGEKGQALQAVALTNRPILKGLPPVLAFSEGAQEDLIKEYAALSATTAEVDGGVIILSEVINDKNEKETKPMKELFKALGLSENATEAEAVAKLAEINAKAGKVETLETEVKALSERIPTKDAVVVKLSDYEALKADAKAGADAAKLLSERDRDDFFRKAVADRRIKPAQVEGLKKLYLSDADGTKAYVLSISPDTVDAKEIGTASGDGGGDNVVNRVKRLVAEKLEKHPKLSEAAAQEQIFNADRALYDEYRAAISVK